jgi:putative Ca2+/H+ antiporter (TMEM165/GDT1 family)
MGIVASTLANHFAAGAVGNWVSGFFSETALSWILAASFVAVALWTLIPDKLDEDEASGLKSHGPFLTTLIAFFLAEMGDKTQVATVMLAAQYPHFLLVVIGTTLGMLIANVPVVLAGNFAAERLPLGLIRRLAAIAFGILALVAAYHALQLSGVL